MFRRSVMGKCLFLGLCLLLSPLQVAATGVNPVISHIQTGTSDAALHELVFIYNNSEEAIDVTNWCVEYASSSDITKNELFCFEPENQQTKLLLAEYSYALIASDEYLLAHPDFVSDGSFSGGMNGSSGHIRLFNAEGLEMDRVGWGTAKHPETTSAVAHETGKLLVRKSIPETKLLQDTNANNLDFVQLPLTELPASGIYEEVVELDVCDNLAGQQAEVPAGYESADEHTCNLIFLETSIIQVTELLPNASSIDTGKEFIELFNPNDQAVQLKGYKLELTSGANETYTFLEQLLAPKAYVAFSDIVTGITLPNSSSGLKLTAPAGNVVSQTEVYTTPDDDQAWALINDVWQFTNRPTPAAANTPSLAQDDEEVGESLAPCPEGKVRNPETNRCKNIETAQDGLTPCKEGQERNPETNRCRNIVNTAAALKDCGAGEERNPETNRCRKVAGAATANLQSVKDIPAAAKTNIQKTWAILALAIAAIGYGIFEWRSELLSFVRRFMPTKD